MYVFNCVGLIRFNTSLWKIDFCIYVPFLSKQVYLEALHLWTLYLLSIKNLCCKKVVKVSGEIEGIQTFVFSAIQFMLASHSQELPASQCCLTCHVDFKHRHFTRTCHIVQCVLQVVYRCDHIEVNCSCLEPLCAASCSQYLPVDIYISYLNILWAWPWEQPMLIGWEA